MARMLLPGELAKHASLSGFARKGGTAVRSLGAVTDAGAVGFKWDTAAQALANTAFASTPAAMYVLVSFAANGTSPQVLPFSDANAGRQAYSDLIETSPTDRVYAAGYCKDSDGTTNQCDEWFGTQIRTFSSWFTKYKIKTYAPWILGGAAVVAAVVYFGGKKKSPGRARRRRGSGWRRRTVTVWR